MAGVVVPGGRQRSLEAEAVPATGSAAQQGRTPVLLVLGLAVLALLLVRSFVVEPLAVAGTSMTPTLQPGEQVLLLKIHPGDWEFGDVVALEPPDGTLMIKRVVATEGQTVAIRDGHLFVDGERKSESYADPDAIDSVYFGPVRVEAGKVFVLGDHRDGSEDSRVYGAIPEDHIAGRVVSVLWPLDKMRTVR